jgi:hypothetical protein
MYARFVGAAGPISTFLRLISQISLHPADFEPWRSTCSCFDGWPLTT